MNSNNLIVDLDGRFDGDDKLYYIGRLKAPIYLDLSEGITLLVFLSESGDEELQIAINDKQGSSFSGVNKKRDRLKIPLDIREDQHKKEFFIAKLHMNGHIRCHDEIVFMVFVSREGNEEIQIISSGGSILCNTNTQRRSRKGKKKVEVFRKRSLNND